MRAEDLRAFATRDWAYGGRAKNAHWRALAARRGAGAILLAGDLLREHVARHAALATPTARRADLLHHLELKRKIDAASARFRR